MSRDGHDLEPVGSELDALLSRLGMPRTVDLGRLVDEWEELAGDPFATLSRPAGFDGGELVVEVSDGTAASLLKYRAGTLLDRLGEHLGEGVVERIRIRVANRKKGS